MKKVLFLFVLICFLAGCQSEPPKPTIIAGNHTLSYKRGTYSWHKNGKGVVADAAPPADIVKQMNEVPKGSAMSITFTDEPSSLSVGIWENDAEKKQIVNDKEVLLPKEKGEFIYVIHASWDEGDAIYALGIQTN